LLFFVVLLAVGAMSYYFYKNLTAAKAHNKANQYIVIARGATPAEIVQKLNDEGVVSSHFPMLAYLRVTGKGASLKSGEYRFPSPISPLAVIEKLQEGEERTTKLTIIEGWTRFEIAKEIAQKFPPPNTENVAQDPNAVFNLLNDASLIADIDPQAKSLEGYLYPDTYNFPREYAPRQVVKTLVERFRKEWKPEYAERARELNKTTKEIVTIASLIETESKIEAERPVVAAVIYNRLNKNMALGLDNTVVYAAKLAGAWDGTIHKSDIERDSPYNTRKYAGLPPSPVSSASASSIKAALYPAQNDYLFYVLNVEKADGSHNFYNNAADFERGKAAYQRWLEEQRAKKISQTPSAP
jgi:UPF0755 protein